MSDTHLFHEDRGIPKIEIPMGDILVHAGDATFEGSQEEIMRFSSWFGSLPHPHKVFIAGNHDWNFQRTPQRARRLLPNGVVYLEDSGCDVMGLKFYGSPWQPEFLEWAFNLPRGHRLREKWNLIPSGIDVLVTHGPPYGVLDQTPHGEHVGCVDMKDVLTRVKPRLHVFGHIHHMGGRQQQVGPTLFVNAAMLDESYGLAHRPIIVDLDAPVAQPGQSGAL